MTGPDPRDHSTAIPASGPGGLDESMWLDVIHKMDEVYSQLVADEIELEKKNEELEQSQRFIFSILSAMSDVLLVCDADGRIEEANAALRELVGRGDDELRAMTFYGLLADAYSVERARVALARTDRVGETVELELATRGGMPVSIDANCTPRIAADGRRAGTVVVGRPTAELKRAYRALQEAHESLKLTQRQLLHSEKMASLGRLVAGVAHELNNPISFVLGNVHALGRYGERLRRYLEAVHAGTDAQALAEMRTRLRIEPLLADLPSLIEGTLEGAQRTADIVGNLKRFSAMDREGRDRVELGEVIERSIHWIRKGTAPGLAVHWSRGEPVFVEGNPGQLQQVLMNLLQNAVDATAGRADAPEITVVVETDADAVSVRVRDNGPGVNDADASRIFDPFFTTKPVGKGTGLGLSISYGIVEQHGGVLRLLPGRGRGADFEMRLPRARH